MAILFIDDDETGRAVAGFNLRKDGFEVDESCSGDEGLLRFDPARHHVVVTDLKMPGTDGMTVLSILKKRAPEVPIIVITAFGSVQTAVSAMKAGAWDFIEKPFSRDQLRVVLHRADEASRLRRQNRQLIAQRIERPIVAKSAAMVAVLRLTDSVAQSGASVLVTGESGVGKELVARRIHARSGRASEPFVVVNCSAIPADLLESELFGHAAGAFTGAVKAREGRFRRASGGTLFLDEIGELPQSLQVKLLRVLQEGVVDVVGSDDSVRVDVRIVAATNRDLDEEVHAGRFREDLFYRLNVIHIEVPPLRERPEDIEPLARRFVTEFAGGRTLMVPPEVLIALNERPWRGNVRELRNICERLAILAPAQAVRVDDLPKSRPISSRNWLGQLPDGMGLFDVERAVIVHALKRHGFNVSRAARALSIPRHILAYRIEKHGVDLLQ